MVLDSNENCPNYKMRGDSLEAAPGVEPGIKDLQSSALPLGYAAILKSQIILT